MQWNVEGKQGIEKYQQVEKRQENRIQEVDRRMNKPPEKWNREPGRQSSISRVRTMKKEVIE